MQKIAAINLQPGMIIAQNVFSIEGVLLLGAGTVLNCSHIERLCYLGLPGVYIVNPLTDQPIALDDASPIREETRVQAIHAVRTAFLNVLTTHRVDSEKFKEITAFLISEIIKSNCAMIHLTDIRSRDCYTFAHSVNVCVLSTLTGVQLGYSMIKLKELALGALLHDVGKMLVPKEILLKPGPLTADEKKTMEQHPGYGFDILRDQSEIPLTSSLVAYQHHERFDGNGYPQNLGKLDIHEYARIVAIADVYDAVTADRPYKQALLPHEAYEITVSLAAAHFDPAILQTFLSQIAIYPLGCVVRTNTGEIAQVIKVLPALQTRPILRAIFDANGRKLTYGREIDLTKELTTFVDKIYTPVELMQLDAASK